MTVPYAPLSPSPPSAPVGTRSGVGRVLLVDDNADLTENLRAVLFGPLPNEGGGALSPIDVRTASCGEEAMAVARTDGFDVAIVDVKLPDGSGVDLIGPLRGASPFGEVILITGYATMDAAMNALRVGAFAFIPKTFHPEELLSTVEQALTKVRLRRERDDLERRYRALVELTDVIVVGLDGNDGVVLFNRKASTVTGVSAEDARGRPFLECWMAPDDRPRMRDALAHVRSSDRPRDVETTVVLTGTTAPYAPRDGTTEGHAAARRVRWHLASVRAEGEPQGLVYGIGIDVTEQRALERRARDAEALSAMGGLALNLAHEIRNPLNAAVLQLHMLGRDVDKLELSDAARAKLHRRAHIVEGEIGRLNRLLTEFLELARPRDIAREPVHVSALVAAVLDLEHDAAAARGITVVRELSAEGCVALGDSAKLKQVILNLVVNAMEAMKNGGTLVVTVACDGDGVRIDVADTGAGIPPELLAQVFDPFFTTKEAGTGLGLSIVRKIVDQHAGDVRIESERGVGTRVRVTLPSRRGAAPFSGPAA